jgi:TIR domain
MAAKVFISYRREDSAAYAGRIQDRLAREFDRDLLFIDVDGIPLGANFSNILREEIAKCGVLLAVIGRDWLDVRDEAGTRRLDHPTDFVRIEIATALQREIPVIPILLDGTSVPKADQLPEDLKELALRHGLNVRHPSFHADLDKLIWELKRQVGASRQAPIGAENQVNGAEADLTRAPGFGNATELPLRGQVTKEQAEAPLQARLDPGIISELSRQFSGKKHIYIYPHIPRDKERALSINYPLFVHESYLMCSPR